MASTARHRHASYRADRRRSYSRETTCPESVACLSVDGPAREIQASLAVQAWRPPQTGHREYRSWAGNSVSVVAPVLMPVGIFPPVAGHLIQTMPMSPP